MTLWGTVTCCMSAVKTYQQLVALRVLIGFLEAGFAPGVLLIISSWYKRSEQSKRFAVYMSAAILAGAFGGLLGGAITHNLEGVHGIRGWRWLFVSRMVEDIWMRLISFVQIVEGAATAGWVFIPKSSCSINLSKQVLIFLMLKAIIAHFILLDFPATSPRLSEREKYVAIRRLQTESVTAKTFDTAEPSHAQAFREALMNWRLWIFTVGYMVCSIPGERSPASHVQFYRSS